MARVMRVRASAETGRVPLRKLETVLMPTLAVRATSRIVGRVWS